MLPKSRAVVVGSGPNGLAAAITLAQSGFEVQVFEGAPTPGGGLRSEELTLPGFTHDVCAAVLPLTRASPFLSGLPLEEHGVSWIEPPGALAHPFDDQPAAVIYRSLPETERTLLQDGPAYRRLFEPFLCHAAHLLSDLLGPARLPRHPRPFFRFARYAVRSASSLARSTFAASRAQALFTGLAAHSTLALNWPISAAFGLVLGLTAHHTGWPLVRGGTSQLAHALTSILKQLGGEIITGAAIHDLSQLPTSGPVFLDVSPRQFLELAGEKLPARYRTRLSAFRYGPGVCKVDWALDGPIPWSDPSCQLAGTVHLGGSLQEIEAAEHAAWQGAHYERPFVILVQPTLFDPSRAPRGKHIAWAYCHVPHGSNQDVHTLIEAQVERFAPGFQEKILARFVRTAAEHETYNPNLIGGDINGGLQDWRQLYTRPLPQWNPYATPLENVFLCSASTPPGGGAHGMCGFHAVRRRFP